MHIIRRHRDHQPRNTRRTNRRKQGFAGCVLDGTFRDGCYHSQCIASGAWIRLGNQFWNGLDGFAAPRHAVSKGSTNGHVTRNTGTIEPYDGRHGTGPFGLEGLWMRRLIDGNLRIGRSEIMDPKNHGLVFRDNANRWNHRTRSSGIMDPQNHALVLQDSTNTWESPDQKAGDHGSERSRTGIPGQQFQRLPSWIFAAIIKPFLVLSI